MRTLALVTAAASALTLAAHHPPRPADLGDNTALTDAPAAVRSLVPAPPTARAAKRMPVGVGGRWHRVWGDSFRGKALNSKHWSVNWPGLTTQTVKATNSDENACYSASQVSLPGDGTLHLKLTRRDVACAGRTQPYLGASVVSLKKFQYAYGLVEARVYLPGNRSGIFNWPAVWSNGAALNWPADGENDTLEGLNGRACWHFHSSVGGPGECTRLKPGWHTVASDWEPGRVTYYYDGRKVGRITSGITSQPQYLALQLTTSQLWGGQVRPGHDVRVDYVRVWQHPRR